MQIFINHIFVSQHHLEMLLNFAQQLGWRMKTGTVQGNFIEHGSSVTGYKSEDFAKDFASLFYPNIDNIVRKQNTPRIGEYFYIADNG